jgi:hypothetical protein
MTIFSHLGHATIDRDMYLGLADLLRGTNGYATETILSFCLALVIIVVGTFYIDLSREHRVIAILSVLYLVSSTFTLAKQVRDALMSRVLNVSLLAGTEQWALQCTISFIIALIATIYAAFSLRVERTTRGFVLIGLSFAMSSTVSLAKMVRDHSDADYFEALDTNTENYNQMAHLLWSSHELYSHLIWGFFIFDVVAFVYALNEFKMSAERMDFLALGATFMVYASLLLAKAVRDKDSKDELLHPSSAHWFMYITAWLLSVGLLLHTILALLPIANEKRAFLTLETICLLSATFNLAKSVRDKEEILWQQGDEKWAAMPVHENCGLHPQPF